MVMVPSRSGCRSLSRSGCSQICLGPSPIHLYKLAYLEKSLWTPGVCAMADLHDLVIDAAKNGYTLHRIQLVQYLKNNSYKSLKTPATMAFNENIGVEVRSFGGKNTRLQDVVRGQLKNKKGDLHILDDILFHTINPVIGDALRELDAVLSPAHKITQDIDLQYQLRQIETMTGSFLETDIQQEKRQLRLMTEKVFEDHWNPCWPQGPLLEAERSNRLKTCYEQYDAIRPLKPNPWWEFSMGQTAPTLWQLFKVGVLASSGTYKMKQKFLFHMAKDAVCYLKSISKSGRQNLDLVMTVKKPRKPKGGLQPLGGNVEVGAVNGDEPGNDEFDSSSGDAFFEGTD